MRAISSLQNPLVKGILLLQGKSRERRKQGRFVCEGLNEIRLCGEGGYTIEQIVYCPENISDTEIATIISAEVEAVHASPEVFNKIAYRDEVRNAVAIVQGRELTLDHFELSDNPLILVVESVEKPGNLGALLRSADAAGVDAVFLADPLSDIYNPNVIRSSVGCVFTVPVVVDSGEKIRQFLKAHNISVFTTFMDHATSAWKLNFSGPTALVVGTESTGLSDAWNDGENVNINIPMFGKVDSMNVSVAAALLMFEAVRQRRG